MSQKQEKRLRKKFEEEVKLMHALGMRDGIGALLAQAQKEDIQLPWVAQQYQKWFLKFHPLHKFHTGQEPDEGVDEISG